MFSYFYVYLHIKANTGFDLFHVKINVLCPRESAHAALNNLSNSG
jgi:hypothetical protein